MNRTANPSNILSAALTILMALALSFVAACNGGGGGGGGNNNCGDGMSPSVSTADGKRDGTQIYEA